MKCEPLGQNQSWKGIDAELESFNLPSAKKIEEKLNLQAEKQVTKEDMVKEDSFRSF